MIAFHNSNTGTVIYDILIDIFIWHIVELLVFAHTKQSIEWINYEQSVIYGYKDGRQSLPRSHEKSRQFSRHDHVVQEVARSRHHASAKF